MEFERKEAPRKRKRVLLARGPFIVLVGFTFFIGLLVGFFAALSANPFQIKLKESPFGPDRASHLPKGKAFEGVGRLEDLPAADREKYVALLRLDEEGKRAEAQALGNALSAAHPDNPLVAGTAAYLHLRSYPGHALLSDAPARAAALLAKAEAAHGEDPWINYAAGLMHERAGRADSARARYLKAIRVSPQFAFAHTALGRHQLERGETGLASSSFRKAIGLMLTSPERYRRGPGTALPLAEPAPFDWLATLFVESGSMDSARMALEYGVEKGWPTPRMALVQGWIWESGGFLVKADSIYRRLLADDPGNAEYARAVATLGWKPVKSAGNGSNGSQGSQAKASAADAIFAIGLLDPLARQNPKNGALWMALGQAYFHRGLFATATECFDSSLRTEPGLPGLAEKRQLAYEAVMREAARAKADKEYESPRPRISAEAARRAAEEQTPVVLPGTIALLGTYSVPWGGTPVDVRQAYPGKTFRNLPGGDLMDEFIHDGVKHEYLLAFKQGKLWAVRIFVTDTAGVGGDLFGRLIRTKTKISGEGKGTGEAACPGFLPFQGAIWETDDTFEFMAQFIGKENQIRLVRLERKELPHNRRLCDLVPFLKTETWDKK